MHGGISAVGMLNPEQVGWVLTVADTAPSLYDSKPWILRCRPGWIELHADRARSLDSADPDQRQMWLACGAVLLNLRLAIRALGVTAVVELVTDPDDPNFIATVSPHELSPATATDLALVDVMLSLRDGTTLVQPGDGAFLGRPVAESARNALRQSARAEQGWLAGVGPGQQPALRMLARQAQQTQDSEAAFVAEWDRWATGLESALDRTGGTEQVPDAFFAVIGTFLDNPAARLQAGQAMQRVVLTAATMGLSAAFSPELVEVPQVRAELRAMIGGGVWPQAFLRLGFRAAVATAQLGR